MTGSAHVSATGREPDARTTRANTVSAVDMAAARLSGARPGGSSTPAIRGRAMTAVSPRPSSAVSSRASAADAASIWALGAIKVDMNINKDDADWMMAQAGLVNGSYVLRKSGSRADCLVLCVCHDGALTNFTIQPCDAPFAGQLVLLTVVGPRRRFRDLAELLEHYSSPEQEGLPTFLTHRVG